MQASTLGPVSHEKLRCLAIKLREDLILYEETLGGTRGFAVLMNTAAALIIAITEPEEFYVSTSGTEKLLEFPSNHPCPTAPYKTRTS
jgi:hypothetical protein